MTQPESHPTRWYVECEGQPQGPYSAAYLRGCLKSGKFTYSQRVCPEGGNQWLPIAEWTELVSPPTGSDSKFSSPPPPTDSRRLFTNPQLPWTANAICVYAIVVRPILFIVFYGFCCVTYEAPNQQSPTAPIELLSTVLAVPFDVAVTGALVTGGLLLTRLKPIGWTWLTYTLLASLLIGTMWCLGDGALLVVASDYETEQGEEAFGAGMVIFVLLMLATGFAEFIFQIFAVVWLFRNREAVLLATSEPPPA